MLKLKFSKRSLEKGRADEAGPLPYNVSCRSKAGGSGRGGAAADRGCEHGRFFAHPSIVRQANCPSCSLKQEVSSHDTILVLLSGKQDEAALRLDVEKLGRAAEEVKRLDLELQLQRTSRVLRGSEGEDGLQDEECREHKGDALAVILWL